jgi:hypothetical protein
MGRWWRLGSPRQPDSTQSRFRSNNSLALTNKRSRRSTIASPSHDQAKNRFGRHSLRLRKTLSFSEHLRSPTQAKGNVSTGSSPWKLPFQPKILMLEGKFRSAKFLREPRIVSEQPHRRERVMTNGVKPLPKTPAMSLHEQWVRCGKPTCRCSSGQLHGPYIYVFWREGGRQRKRYVRSGELEAVRAGIVHEQLARREQRALLASHRSVWSDLRDRLRECERWTST